MENLQVKCFIEQWEERPPLGASPVFLSIWELAGGDESEGDVRVGLALGVRCVYRDLSTENPMNFSLRGNTSIAFKYSVERYKFVAFLEF